MPRHNIICSLLIGCAAAVFATAQAAASSFIEFGSQFTNITTYNTDPGNPFNVNFTGSLGLAGNANSMYLGALLDGMFVGNPHGYSFDSLTGSLNFDSGNITSGTLTFSVTNGLETDMFTAEFASTTHSISWDSHNNQFSITGGLQNIQFGSTVESNTFAGFDVSNFSGGNWGGSFFAFTYDGSAFDDSTGVIATAVIPLPPAAFIGLAGLATVAALRRRRTTA